MAEAISLAKELHDVHGLAASLAFACFLSQFERSPVEVDRLASELIELSTRQNVAISLGAGAFLRGWARSASGNRAEGVPWIEPGIRDIRATGAMLTLPYYLGCKAEALHLGGRTSEALEAINEAEALAERSGERWWCAELQRLSFSGSLVAEVSSLCISSVCLITLDFPLLSALIQDGRLLGEGQRYFSIPSSQAENVIRMAQASARRLVLQHRFG